MKILMISSYLPYPLFSGGQVRLYNLLKELSGQHEITLICEKRSNQTESDIAEVKKFCNDVITVERKTQWSISNIVKAGTSPYSFLLTGHTTPEFKNKIQDVLEKNQYDLIHIETYYVMQNLPSSFLRKQESRAKSVLISGQARDDEKVSNDGTRIPVVLVEHNIEYQVYQKYMDQSPLFVKPLLTIDINKIKKEEEYFWKNADALVAVSREDQSVMQKIGLKPYIVSNGVNTEQFEFKEKSFDKIKTKKILFLGDFKWIQNRDSANFIIKEIWPKIKELGIKHYELRNIKLWIIGRNIPESIKNLLNDPDVLFDTESSAKPTSELFQEASLLLAPIRIGGGTSYKILESMSSGTPVVTMQMSADAINARDGHELMVGKNAEELAKKSLQLLKDKSLYDIIRKNGRALVEKNYTWKEIGKKLDEVYHKVKV